MVSATRKAEIRRQYRIWRTAVGKHGLTQQQVEVEARKHYPEFGAGLFWKIENGMAFPSPSERRALAKVLKVAESELPCESIAQAKAS